MLNFHIKSSSSKWCSGHVKPNFGKPAKSFPLECKNSFLKKRKRRKTIFFFSKIFVLNMLFWPHLEGSLTYLPKIFLRITGSELNSFHKITISRAIPLRSLKVAVTGLSKKFCSKSKDFWLNDRRYIWHHEIFFEEKLAEVFTMDRRNAVLTNFRKTGSKLNSFHKNTFSWQIPVRSLKVAVARLSKNICRKIFDWTTGDTYDTMISFRWKTSSRFYCGQPECSFDKLSKKCIARVQVLFASNPNKLWNRKPRQNKKFLRRKNLKTRGMHFW